MIRKIIWHFFFTTLAIFCTIISSGQSNSNAFAAADTSFFSINNTGGWQIYNSYANKSATDSVKLEIIIQHNLGINLEASTNIGQIKSQDFWPNGQRTCKIDLITMMFELKIDNKGFCYLRLLSGVLPTSNPLVIPVTVSFKQ